MPDWTHEDERDLLMAIIHQQSSFSVNWDQVTLEMGEKFTKKALTLRWAKLKNGNKESTDAKTKNLDSPSKASPSKSTPSKASPAKRARKPEDQPIPTTETNESPSKKAKTKVKEEPV